MNISSEIFSTNGSNSSDHYYFNGTGIETGFNMISIVHFITALFGVPINSYVMWLIVTGTGNGLAAELFTLNLAVCEMFLCIECFLILLNYEYNILWMAVYFLDGVATTVRPLFQCLICVERYLAVVHPVTFLKFKPLRYRLICSVIVWPMGLGFSVSCMTRVLSHKFYEFICFFQFIFFLFIQLFCCVAVLRALKQSGPGERGREREEENHMKRRAFYIIVITTVTMVIIHSPFIVTGILYILSQREILVVYPVSFICFILGGFVQPLLYLHRSGKLSCFCFFFICYL